MQVILSFQKIKNIDGLPTDIDLLNFYESLGGVEAHFFNNKGKWHKNTLT